MATRSPAAGLAPPITLASPARRLAFVALLAAAPLLPHLSSNGFEYPAVSNVWACVPFGALMLLPLADLRAWRRLLHLDLLVLLSFVVALGLERPGRVWPVVLIYPSLLYLACRMIAIARTRSDDHATSGISARPLRLLLPRSWLVIGIAVLAAVHVGWALQGTASTDVARGGVQGAQSILHGRALYGTGAAYGALDPHTDTYGPLDYEAYVPFASVAAGGLAARLTTLLFDLLTALLLFALGRQIRGPTAGVLLAYCWLAFPFTLYEDALGFNDSIVAAALVGTLLAARSPARRGAMAAVAAWSKFSPLALLPMLATYRPHGERGARRQARFAIAFVLATGLIFLPALSHSSPEEFFARTLGFQATRAPGGSVWAFLQGSYSAHAPAISTASRVLHGLLTALAGGLVFVLLRAPRRQDVVGLAAASAALLIALEVCLSYYSFSYILWFAPLVLVAVILERCGSAAADPVAGELL
jgi:hypothetical protein